MIPSVRRFLACLTLFLVSVAVLPAQDAAPSPAATDLKALVDRLTTKIRAGAVATTVVPAAAAISTAP